MLHGGWFPLAVALVIFVVLNTWQQGREIVTRNRRELEGPLQAFVEDVRKREGVLRPSRTAVYLNANKDTAPLALRANLEHNDTLHETVVIVSIETLTVPHVQEAKRIKVDELGYEDDGICHITMRFGFQDDIDIPATLRHAVEQLEGDVDLDGRVVLHLAHHDRRHPRRADAAWRKKLFVAIARNAANPVGYFKLPDEDTVVMGAHVEL